MPTEGVTSKLVAIAPAPMRDGNEASPTTVRGDSLPQRGQSVPPSAEHVQQAAQQIQKFLAESQRSLEFHVDETSGISVVMVRDANTGDVIRQIPNEETVKLAQILKDTGSINHGLLDLTV